MRSRADLGQSLERLRRRGVLELVEDFNGNTYRAVYTVRFENALYVLHAFQKKSKTGIATPQHEIDLIKARLKDAEADHRTRFGAGGVSHDGP